MIIIIIKPNHVTTYTSSVLKLNLGFSIRRSRCTDIQCALRICSIIVYRYTIHLYVWVPVENRLIGIIHVILSRVLCKHYFLKRICCRYAMHVMKFSFWDVFLVRHCVPEDAWIERTYAVLSKCHHSSQIQMKQFGLISYAKVLFYIRISDRGTDTVSYQKYVDSDTTCCHLLLCPLAFRTRAVQVKFSKIVNWP